MGKAKKERKKERRVLRKNSQEKVSILVSCPMIFEI
jgi:hypothetical protein